LLGLTKSSVKNFKKEKINVDILLSNDNYFLAYEFLGNAFYCIIEYVGPEKEASQFKYTFVLESWAAGIMCVMFQVATARM